MRNPNLRCFHRGKWFSSGNSCQKNLCDSIAKGNPPGNRIHECLPSVARQQVNYSAWWTSPGPGAFTEVWAQYLCSWNRKKPVQQICCVFVESLIFLSVGPPSQTFWNDFLGFWKILEMTWHLVSLGKSPGAYLARLTFCPGVGVEVGVTHQAEVESDSVDSQWLHNCKITWYLKER